VLRVAAPFEVSGPALAAITGPIKTLTRSPLTTVGYTGACHERLEITLETGERRSMVVKRTRPSTGRRSPGRITPSVAPVLAYHDERTRAHEGLPLA
jgi:hypothetical protein